MMAALRNCVVLITVDIGSRGPGLTRFSLTVYCISRKLWGRFNSKVWSHANTILTRYGCDSPLENRSQPPYHSFTVQNPNSRCLQEPLAGSRNVAKSRSRARKWFMEAPRIEPWTTLLLRPVASRLTTSAKRRLYVSNILFHGSTPELMFMRKSSRGWLRATEIWYVLSRPCVTHGETGYLSPIKGIQ